MVHKPTGIMVECQDQRSQLKNKAQALEILRSRVYARELEKQQAERSSARLEQVGSGDRSEKIRTYNYPQNRITDHRIGYSIQQLDRVMEGKLDPIIEALYNEEVKRKLSAETK